jgi:rRNA pseudouridine-1189 N-methylase Emg1 (Nep1/Mra1 family)
MYSTKNNNNNVTLKQWLMLNCLIWAKILFCAGPWLHLDPNNKHCQFAKKKKKTERARLNIFHPMVQI